ncbi:response regulator [Clostridium rectalis]|uniref:response regulator n=1 Tax=Clostridium rectalis TaxID=2040295 RepID=UPI000F631BFC|nr:response regulator [Clostridium rectalis]
MSKILIVNDCKFESMILKDILKKFGHDIKVSNEISALNDVKKFMPDVVICNLIMKGITGAEVIQKIKEDNKNIICILSSSNDLKMKDFIKNNVDEIIKTPIVRGELKKILDKFIKLDTNIKYLFCPYCGNQLNNSKFLFCPYCGKDLK